MFCAKDPTETYVEDTYKMLDLVELENSSWPAKDDVWMTNEAKMWRVYLQIMKWQGSF